MAKCKAVKAKTYLRGSIAASGDLAALCCILKREQASLTSTALPVAAKKRTLTGIPQAQLSLPTEQQEDLGHIDLGHFGVGD